MARSLAKTTRTAKPNSASAVLRVDGEACSSGRSSRSASTVVSQPVASMRPKPSEIAAGSMRSAHQSRCSSESSSAAGAFTITIEQGGFEPNEEVEVVLHSDPVVLGTLIADAQGWIRGTFDVPEMVPAGSHEVVMTGRVSGVVVSQAVELPASNPIWLMAGIIGGVLVLGAAVAGGIVTARRRRSVVLKG